MNVQDEAVRTARISALKASRTLTCLFMASCTEAGGDHINSTAAFDGTTSSTTAQQDSALPVSSLMASLGLNEWLKYILLGFVVEIARRQLYNLEAWFTSFFFVTAEIPADDDCYDWLLVWLSKQPAIKNARKKIFSTSKDRRSLAILPEEGDHWCDAKSRRLFSLPSVFETYSLWYRHRLVRVRRVALPRPGYYDREAMELRVLAWGQELLNELLLEAKKDYLSSFEDKICVYVAIPSSSDWIPLATRPKRPIQSIILDSDIQDMVLEDVQEFMRSKAWYTDRGIPFRRGYLLHGSPGSGKTSLIHSIAGELGLNVFLISLSARGMDDTKLAELIAYLPERCITLMEDIDAAFLHGVSRDGVDGMVSTQAQSHSGGAPSPQGQAQAHAPAPTPNGDSDSDDYSGKVTLSGLLNALDGIGAQEGRILFATTNRYAALDPALCRPGRMDMHVEFRHASRRQGEELFKRFFMVGTNSSSAESARQGERQGFQAGNKDARVSRPEDPVSYSVSEASSSEVTLIDVDVAAEHWPAKQSSVGLPQLSAEEINDLAIRFAESIPEREVSMATLQGFLMMHKRSPVDAAYKVGAYVEDLLASSRPDIVSSGAVVSKVESRT
ncbi:P-loop containing nucleoside triphosphate hydrolase protein [Coniophora puteana RWD-64-598 SS2]|uniref:P-loop containing nucleoside triphosphate hydrolase protein n=1 Tax=Coniophora puteana (strain RWD-64-598) TaxID=741705 RepID=A0A5M3M8V3_CONPW|nr:P-loop containing nucleoside triphosphate hydrolase protein [Coniophora puteana RWD-64-598 SS2]EIW75071.1 P-loop containing nucleoside triphosphate hydrolase protein [Coniophora puteana RWD-64-598 SS2]